jgi:hypothetical protein
MESSSGCISKINPSIRIIEFTNIIKCEYYMSVLCDIPDTKIVKQGFHRKTKNYF